ncbi:hypothetical protein U9M48_035160 [Paspalum notatum var. saurae]|uniref:Uncharacterized protein n=1 Tax=Paspalum notatum var. saurae TaxID=547442 RepID=A0AAQ3UAR5_PASNO
MTSTTPSGSAETLAADGNVSMPAGTWEHTASCSWFGRTMEIGHGGLGFDDSMRRDLEYRWAQRSVTARSMWTKLRW